MHCFDLVASSTTIIISGVNRNNAKRFDFCLDFSQAAQCSTFNYSDPTMHYFGIPRTIYRYQILTEWFWNSRSKFHLVFGLFSIIKKDNDISIFLKEGTALPNMVRKKQGINALFSRTKTYRNSFLP